MFAAELLPELPGVRFVGIAVGSTAIVATVETTNREASCPVCGRQSSRVHGRYFRRLTDRSLAKRSLAFRFRMRRFVCSTAQCPRRIFAEPIPGVAKPYARTTLDLTAAHTAIGFAAGGESGSRLAKHLNIPTSPDTLLRRVRAARSRPGPPPRFVGVDDWASKKGRSYGTILIDLERRCVIDLLPGRDGTALTDWLRRNPQVEVVARDRWSAYAKAVDDGAPQAKQVVDRWHLLKNLREAVEGVLARYDGAIQTALSDDAEKPASVADENEQAPPPVPSTNRINAANSKTSLDDARDQRSRRRERIAALWKEGLPIRAIARQLRIARQTVRSAISRGARLHERRGRRETSSLGAFQSAVKSKIAAGETNTAKIHRDLQAEGCQASYDAVRRYANRRLGTAGKPGRRSANVAPRPPPIWIPSARRLSFEWVKRKVDPSSGDEPRLPSSLERVRAAIPELDDALGTADAFAGMIRKSISQPLSEWMTKAAACGAPELANFAAHLKSDQDAVNAALTEPWSNGPVEGQVNRLKAIKRSMYGRANLDLLKARVLRK
jgi:transposase